MAKTVESLADLTRDPANCRKHNPRNIGSIVNSLHKVGAARSIVIDENNVILAGNGMVDAAGEAGIEKVMVVEVDGNTVVAVRRTGLTPKQKAELAIADNRTAELAEWDAEQLLKTIAEHDIDLSEIEFTADEVEELKRDSLLVPTDPIQDEPPSPDEVEKRCNAGDLWQLGEHRLLCGDSVKPESWDCIRSDIPTLVFTSPPYGVGENAKLRDHYVPGQRDRKSLYATHKDSPDEWLELMRGWTKQALAVGDCIMCNVQMLANNKRNLMLWAAEFAPHLVDVVVWDKANGAPQMQPNVLTNAVEWVYILSPDDGASRAIPLSDFHGTQSTIVRINPKGVNEFSDSHRAMMPVALAAWAISLAPKAGIVIDPFGGAGTTMIAAEQMGKASALIETDPGYCDIALARWEKFTGKKAEKAE